MRLGFKVESVAPVSTRIWQGFPSILILVFPQLSTGITGSSLLENSRVLSVLGRVHMGAFLLEYAWGH